MCQGHGHGHGTRRHAISCPCAQHADPLPLRSLDCVSAFEIPNLQGPRHPMLTSQRPYAPERAHSSQSHPAPRLRSRSRETLPLRPSRFHSAPGPRRPHPCRPHRKGAPRSLPWSPAQTPLSVQRTQSAESRAPTVLPRQPLLGAGGLLPGEGTEGGAGSCPLGPAPSLPGLCQVCRAMPCPMPCPQGGIQSLQRQHRMELSICPQEGVGTAVCRE